jgi:transposase InsO family protein
MCAVLNLPRSTFYYEAKDLPKEDAITENVKSIFKESRRNYGTRKIEKELAKINLTASRRRIGRVMRENGMVSNYTIAQYKVHKSQQTTRR